MSTTYSEIIVKAANPYGPAAFCELKNNAIFICSDNSNGGSCRNNSRRSNNYNNSGNTRSNSSSSKAAWAAGR
ncbi:MAG: hypothetical protein K2O39_02400 [Clostridiales bacterium]|nr:hypothetical protein [Clostridiales bacterium]